MPGLPPRRAAPRSARLGLEDGQVACRLPPGCAIPSGLAWNPWTGELWATVNERDQLGSDLVPDYLTNVPVGAQYGWPWLYWGKNIDDRVEGADAQFHQPNMRRKPVSRWARTSPRSG